MKTTIEECRAITEKYTKLKVFREENTKLYNLIWKRGWSGELLSHMEKYVKPVLWDYEKAKETALRYTTKMGLYKEHRGCYNFISNNNLMDELCRHMVLITNKPTIWTKEKCKIIIDKYTDYKTFKDENVNLYSLLCQNGWREELLDNLDKSDTQIHNFWDKERCKIIIDKYTDYKTFLDTEKKLYALICDKGWRKELLGDLDENTNKRNKKYWTKERCQEIALKFTNRVDFKKSGTDTRAYKVSLENGWLDEICSHMNTDKWSFEICKEIASKYSHKNDFIKGDRFCYEKSKERGFLEEVCSHMIPLGNVYNKLIYVYIFTDNSAYVGLTCNSNKRHKQHMREEKSAVFKHIKKTNLIPEKIELTEYIDVKEAIKLEEYYTEKYRIEGYNILNIAKTGNIGGSVKRTWTYDECKEESSKYNTCGKFKRNRRSAYDVSLENGWLDDFYPKKEKESL